MADGTRVMVISHGHPESSPGGGEIAAYTLFRGLRERPGVEALFVSRAAPTARQRAGMALPRMGEREVVMRSETELFRHSQRDRSVVHRDFRRLLDWFRPDVVHFHHYLHLGLELLREVRAHSPSVPIVLTLHEFLAICHHNGQMVKTWDRSLCERATPTECQRCFPAIAAEDFFLRELYVKSLLRVADAFVSPSRFLIGRYVDWGLPADRFTLIENGLAQGVDAAPAASRPPGRPRTRLGFFGQILPVKGLHVLLEAMSLLPAALRTGPSPMTLDIHGSRLAEQRADYQNAVLDRLKTLGDQARLHGPYSPGDRPALMRSVDWLVVPSIWWENSPLVIQEAFAHGLPVICSGIGGMAEKVSDGVNGLHFRVADAPHLAQRLVEAVTTPGLHERLRSGIPAVSTAAEMAAQHMRLYAELLARAREGQMPGLGHG